MSCESCVVGRRQFVTVATLAAVSAVLSSCGGGGGDGDSGPTGPGTVNPPPPVTGPVTVRVADFPELGENLRPVAVNGSIAVVRTAPGQFLAFSRACTHEGTTVNVDGNAFSCPNHGSRFDATGAVTNGPAASPLKRLTVAFDASAGTLTITP